MHYGFGIFNLKSQGDSTMLRLILFFGTLAGFGFLIGTVSGIILGGI